MARLVVSPGSPASWTIDLKPGDNFLGRGLANDFVITDASISSSHCQVVVNGSTVLVRDLGSTNGTFVNRTPIQEAALQTGQTVHLGGLEMTFYGDEPAYATAPPPAASALPPIPVPISPIRASEVVHRVAVAAPVATAVPRLPPTAPPMAGAPAVATGSRNCKHHPKSPGRYQCNQCHHYFCELCVTARTVSGAQHQFCRLCGGECTPVQVRLAAPVQRRFFPSLPGVFIYPFRGAGVLVLIVATLIFAGLERFSGFFFILLKVMAVGYLFSFMQTIIHSTAAEENEMPGLPGMDDVFAGCFRLLGCVAISFGLVIGLGCVWYFNEELRPTVMLGLIPTALFGCFYFPMALLAVAMKDSVASANPLIVMPAIFKAPVEYLVTVILLGIVCGIRVLGGIVVTLFASDIYHTRSMSQLFINLGLNAFWSFFVVYLLAVNMRTLGLLYITKKDKFGWFSH